MFGHKAHSRFRLCPYDEVPKVAVVSEAKRSPFFCILVCTGFNPSDTSAVGWGQKRSRISFQVNFFSE